MGRADGRCTGLTADRRPPALGVALGGAACGLYALTQGRAVPHLVTAAVLFALAVTAPALVWWHRRGSGRRPGHGHQA
ncbi:hypothetical protein ACOBQB_35295 [Streptomyces sp. G5(2025)]|uniref:hypothetical protein n=1 Tax=Streptomyces sp. G5(2025) TaxID=3406628 RepID=UPI003C1AB9E4